MRCKLASEGADIIAVDLCDQIASVPYPMATADDLAATVKLVEDTGARIVASQGDVRDRASLSTALQAGLDEFGRLDIVIANAGIAPMQSGDDGWRDVIDVNLTGVHNTVKAAIPTMVEQGRGGSIVLISSAAGLAGIGSPDAGSIGYTAAKHGVVGLMRVTRICLPAQYSGQLGSSHRRRHPDDQQRVHSGMARPDGRSDRFAAQHGQCFAGGGFAAGGHRQRGGVAGVRPGPLYHRRDVAGRRGLS